VNRTTLDFIVSPDESSNYVPEMLIADEPVIKAMGRKPSIVDVSGERNLLTPLRPRNSKALQSQQGQLVRDARIPEAAQILT
jgi:hypothetical protein